MTVGVEEVLVIIELAEIQVVGDGVERPLSWSRTRCAGFVVLGTVFLICRGGWWTVGVWRRSGSGGGNGVGVKIGGGADSDLARPWMSAIIWAKFCAASSWRSDLMLSAVSLRSSRTFWDPV